jgi:hypothetical protein
MGRSPELVKKRTGHSQIKCKSKKTSLRQDKNEIGVKKLPQKLFRKTPEFAEV